VRHAGYRDVSFGVYFPQDKVSWALRDKSPDYNYNLLRTRLDGLRQLRRGFDAADIAYNLRDGLHRNIGGMCNPALYSQTHIGTKVLIQVTSTCACIRPRFHSIPVACLLIIGLHQ
jgi:Domain of unknown function (DUF3336)